MRMEQNLLRKFIFMIFKLQELALWFSPEKYLIFNQKKILNKNGQPAESVRLEPKVQIDLTRRLTLGDLNPSKWTFNSS